jgi:hypothetical protein
MYNLWCWNNVKFVCVCVCVDVNGWNVKTLKHEEREVEGAKLQDGWASWRVVDVKSLICVVFLCFWLFLLACRLFVFDVLLFNGAALLIWVWWWNGFIVVCVMALWWNCVSHCVEMVGGEFHHDWWRVAYILL